MKFKYLIIAFSIVIIAIIMVAALLPIILSEPVNDNSPLSFAANFRFITLPLLIFMALLLACMSMFFFLNYRLFSLLEREDWPALAYYLEQKIFVKNRYKNRNVRLLASSYLVISDFQSVIKLESKAMLAKPSVISKNVLIFGAARILSGNQMEAAAFFRRQMEKCRKKDKQWVRWFHSFSHLLSGTFNVAEPELSSLAISSNDALISGLSAYFLTNSVEKYSLNPQKCRDTAESARKRVVKAINNYSNWVKEANKMGTDIHIAIIKKYIDEAGNWLFYDRLPVQEIKEQKPQDKIDRRTGDRRKKDRRAASINPYAPIMDEKRTNDRRTENRRT